MNRNLGMSAGVVALLALILHMAPVGVGTDQKSAAPVDTKAVREPKSPEAGNCDQCTTEFEGPWLATRAVVRDLPDNATAPPPAANCGTANEPSKSTLHKFGVNGQSIATVLVTIPSPWHTHLALLADSELDAIETAATAAGWVFARQWLPWRDPIDADEKDPEKRRRQRIRMRGQEEEPGVLVFQQEVQGADKGPKTFLPKILLVFVVGDTPTGGLARTQFSRARHYMKELTGCSGVLVLGPAFSGSFRSLRELIDADEKSTYEIRSGMASSVDDAEALTRGGRVSFRATYLSSRDFGDSFFRALQALGIKRENAAVLAEDETRFASAVGAQSNLYNVLTLKFPRDISQLRNAYRETKTPVEENALAPEVEFSLKDTEIGEDSIPAFSGAQWPPSQDARLEQAVDTIRRDQILAVELINTNPLDGLFVARVLEKNSPDTRIILPNANLLLVEAGRSQALRNVLTLSSYPLFQERRWFVPPPKQPLLTHPDSLSEAFYNAMLLLLDKADPNPRHPLRDTLNDYGWQGQPHPPVWLLKLDRNGFLPLRVWKHSEEEEKSENWWEQRSDYDAHFDFLPSGTAMVWALMAGMVGLGGLAALIRSMYLWKWNSGRDGKFLPLAVNDKDRWRLFYLAAFLLLVASMLAILLVPWWEHLPKSHWVIDSTLIVAAALVLVVLALMISVSNTELVPEERALSTVLFAWVFCGSRAAWMLGQAQRFALTRRRRAWWDSMYARLAIAVVLAGCICGVAAWWVACTKNEEWDSGGVFFALRAVEMRIGSSPAIPMLAGISALALFCYTQMKRLYLAARQEPEVMQVTGSALHKRIEGSRESLSERFRSRFGLVGWLEWWYLAAALVLSLDLSFAFHPFRNLAAEDGVPFNWLLIAVEGVLVAALLHGCVQMSALYHYLRSFLTCLGTLPLTSSFIARERVRSKRPIWVQDLNLQSLSTLVRGPTMLHDLWLQGYGAIGKAYDDYRTDLRALVDESDSAKTTRTDRLRRSMQLNSKNANIATMLFQVVLRHWLLTARVGRLEPAEEKVENADPYGQVGIPGDPSKIADLAATFVALHFTPFVLYSILQIRELVWFLSFGFVGLVVAMNADSPQSPRMVSRFLLALFVVIAATMWRCLAGIERDPIVSRIEGTKAGELNLEFYFKLIGYGALPALGLLASEFPSIANFLFSWIEPTLAAIH